MKSYGSKSMSPVGKDAFISPSTRTVVVADSGSASVTMYGPIGLNVSLFLQRQNVRSTLCQPRALTSFPIVQPNTAALASSLVQCLTVLPMTATSSPSATSGSAQSAGRTIGSRCPIRALLARYPISGRVGTVCPP